MDTESTARPPIPREIWILVGASFIIAVGFGLISPVLPDFARSFDVGVSATSVVISAFAFFRLVSAPGAGALMARIGERRVYLTGLIVVALSSLATAAAADYAQLLAFRAIGGIGSTMFTISAMALVVRLAPPTIRGRVSSLWGSAFVLGSLVGPVAGGLLAVLGMRLPFVVYALTLLAAATVVAIGLGGDRLRPAPSSADRPVLTLRTALRHRAYRAALISGAANGWSNLGARMLVVPLLATALVGKPWAAGAALSATAVGTAIALQIGGRISDRRGRRPLVLVGMTVCALSTAPLGLLLRPEVGGTGGLVALLVLSLVAGVGSGLVGPGQQAALADLVGSDRSGPAVFSTYQMAQDAGVIAGPIVTGVVIDLVGFEAGGLLLAVVCLVGAASWIRAPETLGSPIGHR